MLIRIFSRLRCFFLGHVYIWHRGWGVLECFHCLHTKAATFDGNGTGNPEDDHDPTTLGLDR
jgi:hypothetical protein